MVDLARKILLYDKIRFLITVTGVAFAVTLVFVQVGLFEGLLANASVTIEQIDADLWVSARNTPNVDFSNTFPETFVQRVRSVPGVARADNLIVWFGRVALPSGATENAVLYAMEDFTRWNLPWQVNAGNARNLRRGKYVILDDSATKCSVNSRWVTTASLTGSGSRSSARPARRAHSPPTRSHSWITALPSRWTGRAFTTARLTSW